jgi:SAM-dependent methyltransferase
MTKTIEVVREYWDRQPCNVLHSPAGIGSSLWSEQVTQRKYFVEPHIPDFAQFPRWKGKQVLEIGCGIGTDTLEFIKAGVAHIDAIDLSGESLRLAFNRVTMDAVGASRAHFLRINAEELLPVGEYDLIYSFGVLHHTPHPEKVLHKAFSRLKDTGEFRIMLYAKWSIKRLFGFQPEAQAGCPLVRWYSGWEARHLLWHSGFIVESIHKTHIFPWQIDEYKEHRYVKLWYYRWMPAWAFRLLERALGTHLLIVARKA